MGVFRERITSGHPVKVSAASIVALDFLVAQACSRRVQLWFSSEDGSVIAMSDPDHPDNQYAMAYPMWEPSFQIRQLRYACEVTGRDFLGYFGGIDREKWWHKRCDEYVSACRVFVTDELGEVCLLPYPESLFRRP
jgi:hypothetical protein